jgi:hypothetical protein
MNFSSKMYLGNMDPFSHIHCFNLKIFMYVNFKNLNKLIKIPMKVLRILLIQILN